jgi:formylglycine-generating enzyme required for sulfatase activity
VTGPLDIAATLPGPFGWCEIPAGSVTVSHTKDMFHAEDYQETFAVDPFLMAKYPVTFAQFQMFAGEAVEDGPVRGEQKWPIDTHPRENVSWWDAVEFCDWLNVRLRLPQLSAAVLSALGELTPANLADFGGLRLPTEWEWQWAAQGDDGRAYPWGADFDAVRCNTEEGNIKQTTPVDRYPSGASPFGVVDMTGNVWEWCLNNFGDPHAIVPGNTMDQRAKRGGSWESNADASRVVHRALWSAERRGLSTGFRLACALPAVG